MKKLNESQLVDLANELRTKLDELQSFDQMQAAQKGKPVAKPVTPAALPKGSPGPRPSSIWARIRGDDARWDTANAGKWNPDGTAKKPAVAVAKAPVAKAPAQAADPAPAQAGTPAAATSVDAAKAAGAAMNAEPAAPAAPAAPAGPWPAGSAQDKAWQALSPEDQKWLGGADPTDQMILARAPNGGKPAAAPAAPATGGQGASPAPAQAVPGVKAGGEVVDTRGGAAGQDEMEESASFQNDELTRLVSLVQYR